MQHIRNLFRRIRVSWRLMVLFVMFIVLLVVLGFGYAYLLNQTLNRLDEVASHHLEEELGIQAYVEQTRQFEWQLWLLVAVFLLGILVLLLALVNSVMAPLQIVQEGAEDIAGGNFDRRLDEAGHDEIAGLARSFNRVTDRVRDLVESLEFRVAERTRALEVVVEVGREATASRDLDTLSNRVISLIAERLDFYHVQVFLLDDVDAYAMLYASTGEMGRYLLAQEYKIRVGSPTPVGQAATGRTVSVTQDTAFTLGYKPDPSMPETRTQIVLPLRAGEKVIGVLDMQSRTRSVVDNQDMSIFETLAAQLAAAISSIRVREQMQDQARDLDRLRSQLSRREWAEFIDTYGTKTALGYRYDLSEIEPVNEVAVGDDGFSVPIRLGSGEVIGTLQAARPDQSLGDDEAAVVQAVAERLGLAIENARLFQNTQSALQENALLYEGSARINAAGSFEELLEALRQSSVMERADVASLMLYDRPWVGEDKPEWLEMVAHWSRDGLPTEKLRRRYRLADFSAVNLLSPASVFIVDDIETLEDIDENTRALYRDLFEVRSVIFAPLTVGGRWIGWVSVMWYEPATYTDAEIRRLEALCAQAAVSVQSQLRLQETQKRAERERVLRDISDRLQGAVDMEELIEIAANELNRALGGSQTLVQMGDAMTLLGRGSNR